MIKIESQLEFMDWAQRVNQTHTLCDLQDDYAHSDTQALKTWFIESSEHDKELLIFSIQKAMGSAALLEFIRRYSNHKAMDWLQEEMQVINAESIKLWEDRQTFEAERNNLNLKITSLETDNKSQDDKITTLLRDNQNLYRQNSKIEANNAELQTELDRLWAFETHIKSLLTETTGPDVNQDRPASRQ